MPAAYKTDIRHEATRASALVFFFAGFCQGLGR
jgi:hypothetical protein